MVFGAVDETGLWADEVGREKDIGAEGGEDGVKLRG